MFIKKTRFIDLFGSLLILLFGAFSCGDSEVLDLTSQKIFVPTLVTSIPASGFSYFSCTNKITLQFSIPMDTNSIINNLSFFRGGFEEIYFTNQWLTNNSILVIFPINTLQSNQPYTIKINSLAVASNNINFSSDVMINFATDVPDTQPPVIVSINPTNNETGVPSGQNITIQFSEKMDTNSVQSAFSLLDNVDKPVTGSFYWAENNLIFQPDNVMKALEIYSLLLDNSCTDLVGNSLTNDYSVNFIIYGSYSYKNKVTVTNAKGIAFNKFFDYYVINNQVNDIVMYDACGIFAQTWAMSNVSSAIEVDKNGDVYISDPVDHCIKKYDANGNYYGWFGKGNLTTGFHINTNSESHSFGAGSGELNSPHGIVVDASSNIIVVDAGNNRLQKISSNGDFISAFGSTILLNPSDVAIDNNGYLYVVDNGNNRVVKFSPDEIAITNWGGLGSIFGKFNNPQAIAIDTNNNIFITDQGNKRVQRFSTNGRFITSFSNTQFQALTGIAINGENEIFVCDELDDSVSIYYLSW